MIKNDYLVSCKYMDEILGVNKKTITRHIKTIPSVRYVWKEKNVCWEVD